MLFRSSSQFKPPRSINTSLSSAGKEGEDGMEHLRDWEGIKTVKRMRMSTDSPEAASLKPDDGCSTSDAADKNITDLTATNITADHGEGESHTSISPVSTTPLPLENSLEFASTGWMTVTQTPIRSNESRISRSPSTPWFLIPAKIRSQKEGSITPRTSDSHRGSHSRIPTPKVNAETIEELMAEKEQLEAEIKELEGRGNKAEDLDVRLLSKLLISSISGVFFSALNILHRLSRLSAGLHGTPSPI